jgi:hypothetical protein
MKVMRSGDLADASRLRQHLSLRTQESRWQVASSGGALTDAWVQKSPSPRGHGSGPR